MNTASSNPPSTRSLAKESLRSLDRITPDVAPAPRAPRLASGVYRMGDEFAGLERLDRAELDETDETDKA
ncbi:MAG: hypothetical protein ACLQVI_24255 [Polyangiaceae bacterium]